jgi:Histidine kinase-, DNA gyrase B-, and HSP90-like ATPase
MANLLSNAAKFSPAGTAVEASMEVGEGRAGLAVKDRGPGIRAEFQPRIFQRFAQASGSGARVKGATGLGLAISQALIERMVVGSISKRPPAPARCSSSICRWWRYDPDSAGEATECWQSARERRSLRSRIRTVATSR